MMQSNSTDLLTSSLEGALRQPGPPRPMDADRTLPADQPAHAQPPAAPARAGDAAPQAREPESPLVLYGRLGYIARSLIHPE